VARCCSLRCGLASVFLRTARACARGALIVIHAYLSINNGRDFFDVKSDSLANNEALSHRGVAVRIRTCAHVVLDAHAFVARNPSSKCRRVSYHWPSISIAIRHRRMAIENSHRPKLYSWYPFQERCRSGCQDYFPAELRQVSCAGSIFLLHCWDGRCG
jgi:hypothetical protein